MMMMMMMMMMTTTTTTTTTEMALETSIQYRHLTQVIARKYFIVFSSCESSRSYIFNGLSTKTAVVGNM
jgi:hypothetical protein